MCERSTDKASITGAYNANAAFRITVPFAARGNGLSAEVKMIISLKIRLNAGAIWFASSTIGLTQDEVKCLIIKCGHTIIHFGDQQLRLHFAHRLEDQGLVLL